MIWKKEVGNKHFRCNALNEAIRCYREAAELAKKLNNPEMSAILHFNLAMSYDKLGAHNQAADECAAAVKLNENYIKAHVKRAEIFMSQGKYDEAVICYEHICELDSTKRDDAMRRITLAKELSKRAKKPDQHEILGLRPHFTLDDLRAAYKQKARAHHPDKHSDADVVTRRIQEKIFKEASEAYSFFRKRFG
jgi:DnaJ family protein C protein 7